MIRHEFLLRQKECKKQRYISFKLCEYHVLVLQTQEECWHATFSVLEVASDYPQISTLEYNMVEFWH